jgi:hypothetical protein
MSAIVIRFPRAYRPPPPSDECELPLAVRVLPAGSYGEHLVVADGHGWLFGDLTSALREAVALADNLNAPIEIDH